MMKNINVQNRLLSNKNCHQLKIKILYMNLKPLLKFKNKRTKINIIYILSKLISSLKLHKYRSLNKENLLLLPKAIKHFLK